MKSLAIVILAAGASARMGIPKQLLPFQNDTLLGTVLKNATHTKIETIYCVVGANASEVKKTHQHYKVTFITNPNHATGLSSSIQKAVSFISENHLGIEAILFLLGDQPFITSEYIQNYIDLHLKHPRNIIATSYANNVGVPALFPKHYFGNLQTMTGDQGAKHLLNGTETKKLISLPSEALIDIDTLETYESIIRSLQ
ncbi:nucleotidyltransferase family protein [Cochleicola gelatinilyticus]|uniref:MobA-like NTP transferase domain-containing protein n=1 Tax=Cochleicola gelatinilyticus TaxID=1763537 RepID=A0A167KFG2_9FLAO|nr:nucleotidyltransferase family protein [Cochleicola gelatinilyticus]OAB81834.1 hypothetical protein ULVI_00420 [Cochleicola gelatinilyticus]